MSVRRLLLTGALCALAVPVAAQAQVQPHRANDAGGFHDVLPPGANGRTNAVELAAFLTAGRRPAHNDDQRDLYARLLDVVPGVGRDDLGRLFKESAFGVAAGEAERSYSPTEGLTILRDRAYGVPHVYGATREAAMFGLGYVAAEDRLFFIDVLRNAGRAQLSSFAGGAAGNRAMDRDQWATAPYTEADLQSQIDRLDDLYGAEGRRVQADIAHYVAGINRLIAEARLNPTKLPGEYAAIGRPLGPEPWRGTDVIATASLVGGIFGKGGGRELEQMELRRSFLGRFGARTGERLWREWAAYEDPDAPTTVRRRRFPYQHPPKRVPADAFAIADAGSLERPDVVAGGTGSGGRATRSARGGILDGLLASLRRQGASNALLVSREESRSGRPLAVFGPQTGYFSPQILMEQDVHAPGIDARGAAFPGVNLYVQLGRGRDYAFSATSASQDIVDTFAVELCEPDGSAPSTASRHYAFRGACRPIEVLERANRWTPSPGDMTAPGAETLRAERTALGLVTGRATIAGRPVLYTALRSTYRHEVDSALGFADFNDPEKMRSARDFQRAAHKIGYTFNWFYVDDRDVAYFNSGNNPQRARGTVGQLPMPAKYEWRGFDPDANTAAYTSFAKHPQTINGQPFITSWNNKQARSYRGADSSLFSSVYRSDMLDSGIRARIGGERKADLPGLVEAMGEAATTDLRAERVLPLALRVIGTPEDPELAEAARRLRAWVADGAHRRDLDGDGRYEHSDAVRILDALWPLWMRAQFEPVLGEELFAQLEAAKDFDNEPNNDGGHLGSAYQNGWYGYAAKDLRRVLGLKVRRRYGRAYCGRGSRAGCREALLGALGEALEADPAELYEDRTCAAAGRPGDQKCFDSISFRAVGGVTQPLIPWQNRPTYQLAVEVGGG